jgi:hypothetical protein
MVIMWRSIIFSFSKKYAAEMIASAAQNDSSRY